MVSVAMVVPVLRGREGGREGRREGRREGGRIDLWPVKNYYTAITLCILNFTSAIDSILLIWPGNEGAAKVEKFWGHPPSLIPRLSTIRGGLGRG